jgi:hypothetical protein
LLQLRTPHQWIVGLPPVSEALRRTQRRLGRRAAATRWERVFKAEAEASALERQLRPLARRVRRQRTLEFAPPAVLAGVGEALVVAVVARLFNLPGLLWLGLAVAPLATLVLLWRMARRPIGPFETARRTDAELLLRERLATALELLDGDVHGPVADRQVADATAAAAGIEARQAFPVFAAGSEARRQGYRQAGLAAAGLLVVALLALVPFGGTGAPWDEERGKEVALADPGSEQNSIVQEPPRTGGDAPGAVAGQTERPGQVGEQQPGLAGSNQQNQQGGAGQQGGEGSQSNQQAQAQQDASSQRSASVAQRQQALQDLGNALRNSQTAKQAAESLRSGDTQRASQQLAQVANQVGGLSPGERRSLSQDFDQAAQQIGDKDRTLADASKRAADALSQYKNQEAQQAIKDAANQVRDTGQQAEAQRQLDQRAQDLQKGNQPSLPQGQSSAQGQQGQQGQQGSQGNQQQNGQAGQNAQTRSGGDSSAGNQSLSDLENDLRSGAMSGASTSGGQGAGSGEGSDPLAGAPHRLSVDARVVQVEAEEREGPTQWRPPNPNAPPAAAPPPAAAAAGAPASAAPVGAGPDLNSVPWDLASSVQKYFTPDSSKPSTSSGSGGSTTSTSASGAGASGTSGGSGS